MESEKGRGSRIGRAGGSFEYVAALLADSDVRSWLRGEGVDEGRSLLGSPLTHEQLNDAASIEFAEVDWNHASESNSSASAALVPTTPTIRSLFVPMFKKGSIVFMSVLFDSRYSTHFLRSSDAAARMLACTSFHRAVVDMSTTDALLILKSSRRQDDKISLELSVTSSLTNTLGEGFLLMPGALDRDPYRASALRRDLVMVSTVRKIPECSFCALRASSRDGCQCAPTLWNRSAPKSGSGYTSIPAVFKNDAQSLNVFWEYIRRFRGEVATRVFTTANFNSSSLALETVSVTRALCQHRVLRGAHAHEMRALLLSKLFIQHAVDRNIASELDVRRRIRGSHWEVQGALLNSKGAEDQVGGEAYLVETMDSAVEKSTTTSEPIVRRISNVWARNASHEAATQSASRTTSAAQDPEAHSGVFCTAEDVHLPRSSDKRSLSSDGSKAGSVAKRQRLSASEYVAGDVALSRKHECEHCGARFMQLSHLKAHVAQIHVAEYAHACDECGKKFKTIGNLNQHTRTVHATDRNFTCNSCGKSYKQSSKLRRHMRTAHV
uniref:C2H2-type domain-containing protein n=1 Tax=Erythrolobus australicus TaxID=1077150 RepID=A0A7S1TKC1_9RHOD